MKDVGRDGLLLPKGHGDKKIWNIVNPSARAFFIAREAVEHEGPVVVVTAQSNTALILLESLKFFCGDFPVIEFPDWETLPYDSFAPNPSIVSSRLKSLLAAYYGRPGITVVSVSTLMHKTVPPEFLLSRSFLLRKNQNLSRDSLRQQLVMAGYHKVDNVRDPGDFAVRGSLIDFFPMAQDLPVRVDFFGDEIDEIRYFDVNTQRSTATIESLRLMPASEVPQDADKKDEFIVRWNTMFPGESRQSPVFCDVSSGLLPAGIEYYLPLYFEKMASFFSYLPETALVIAEHNLAHAAEVFWKEAEERYTNLCHQRHNPILEPHRLFFRHEEIMSQLSSQRVIKLTDQDNRKAHSRATTKPIPSVLIKSQQKHPLSDLDDFCRQCPDPVLVCCDGSGRAEMIAGLLKDAHINFRTVQNWQEFIDNDYRLSICSAPLMESVWLQGFFVLIAENSLYGEHPARQVSRQRQPSANAFTFHSLVELTPDCQVVHLSHGVGIYRGLETLQIDDYKQEFVCVEYSGGDKLYVPVTDLHLMSRYQGKDRESVVLDKLGSDQWQRKKDKATQKARDTAIELLATQAKRATKQGLSIEVPTEDYHKFAAQFSYIETRDQAKAIEDVIADMCSKKRMDRLVCGDVGFGKTEVAMRAAFLAVQNSNQVILLAPTTLLAKQHFDSFRDRFSSWPINVEMMSRFRSNKEIADIWALLEQGKVDVVIGTHSLLSGRGNLEKVGLLIIDEEHRFGVRQKEHLKKARSEVDILSLTATPIPRTLNFSLGGLRDLSVIATAPANRLAIKTFVHNHRDHIVREAIVRELMRGGQVFVIYNQVRTIEARRQKIQELVPEARIGIAHGQMPKRELETTMNQFYHRKFNLLLCSTIIETGIDIPSANTIVIERADKFGLAQLHQLRGRVGRSCHQAYAYLMVPEYLTQEAKERLDAISAAETLGSGFTLAMRDMEIRGAGELLGESQSGEIEKIGFTMYLSMLERAIKSVQSGGLPDEPQQETKINLGISALIPDDYLPDVHNRLLLYRRIVSTTNKNDLALLRMEIVDRFGAIPEPLHHLFLITDLREEAQRLAIERIQFSRQGGYIAFSKHTPVNPADITRLVEREPQTYGIATGDRLKIQRQTNTAQERIEMLSSIMTMLSSGLSVPEEQSGISA